MLYRTLLIVVFFGLCACSTSSGQILFYNFNDCRQGTATETRSTGSNHLDEVNYPPESRQASNKYWSANGGGVSGAPGDYALDFSSADGMGSNGKGGVAVIREAGTALSGLKSFTLCGWFKAKEIIGSGARFFDMKNQDGGGILLGCDGGKIGLQVGNAGWQCRELEYPEVDTWVFFAVAYDATQPANNLRFYKGTAGHVLQTSVMDVPTAEPLPAFDPLALTIGNNSGSARPFKGLLDNMAIYGSTDNQSGALKEAEINKIFQSATAKTKPAGSR